MVKAERAHDEPGTHLACIIVPRKPCWAVVILAVEYLTHMLLRLLRCTGESIQIRDVMARLIPMVIQIVSE
jgi:hypothetical protein